MTNKQNAVISKNLLIFAIWFMILIFSINNARAEIIEVNDTIYQATGFGNTFMVVTKDGNVILDTSGKVDAMRHKALLQAKNSGPVKYIIITHAHGDHIGGLGLWKDDQSKVVAQRNCVEFLHYRNRLVGFFKRRAAAQFPRFAGYMEMQLAEYERRGWPGNYNADIFPTILFDDKYQFELGGVKFELFHTPGETYDQISIWLPQYKVVHVADNFYDSFPNLYTLRGTKPRWALDYVESLNKIMGLEPEILIRGHGKPIYGKETIKKRLTQYRNAILYVHDATVKGMNEGKDVFTLMHEIKLPPDLDIGEGYGKVSWSVRGIYEGYAGWFNGNPANMYETPAAAVYPELVSMAGGASAVGARASKLVRAGQVIKGLHLADIALKAEPQNKTALEVRLEALEILHKKAVNSNERGWLSYGIRTTKARLFALTSKN